MSNKPVFPVKPTAMHIVFDFNCPQCDNLVQALAQSQPSMTRCPACKAVFPLMPIDGRTLHFLYLMLDNGTAAVDPDFL